MNDVGILIVDNDITSQGALKHVLGSEGWRVEIVPLASEALAQLATGAWNLAIVNIAVADVRGPLFSILRELSRVEPAHPEPPPEKPSRLFRVLFLVPMPVANHVQPFLEQEGLPYSLKPYHLHDFLEKVSDLLQEAGAIAEPIRGISGFSSLKKRPRAGHPSRDGRGQSMFASRDDYQMTEEEIADFERQEAEERKKKREKIPQDGGRF